MQNTIQYMGPSRHCVVLSPTTIPVLVAPKLFLKVLVVSGVISKQSLAFNPVHKEPLHHYKRERKRERVWVWWPTSKASMQTENATSKTGSVV